MMDREGFSQMENRECERKGDPGSRNQEPEARNSGTFHEGARRGAAEPQSRCRRVLRKRVSREMWEDSFRLESRTSEREKGKQTDCSQHWVHLKRAFFPRM